MCIALSLAVGEHAADQQGEAEKTGNERGAELAARGEEARETKHNQEQAEDNVVLAMTTP